MSCMSKRLIIPYSPTPPRDRVSLDYHSNGFRLTIPPIADWTSISVTGLICFFSLTHAFWPMPVNLSDRVLSAGVGVVFAIGLVRMVRGLRTCVIIEVNGSQLVCTTPTLFGVRRMACDLSHFSDAVVTPEQPSDETIRGIRLCVEDGAEDVQLISSPGGIYRKAHLHEAADALRRAIKEFRRPQRSR